MPTMEPRMRPRQKGQQFATADLEAYLVAFGDDHEPLKETVKVLDEIVTDYIIETCHTAALSAAYSRRAKIKVDDFKFVLRRDPVKLGRVLELHSMQREIKTKKRMFEVDEKRLGREAAAKEAKAASKKKGDDQDDTEKAKAAEASATTQPDHDLNDDIVNGLLDDLDDEDIANGGHGDDDLDDRENAKKRPRIS